MSELKASLYDVNKVAMNNLSPLDPLALNAAAIELGQYLVKEDYTMLLSNERRDYTVFHSSLKDEKAAARIISNTLNNRGFVLSIKKAGDNAYEIWIRDIDTNENFIYFLFPYSEAVVEV